MNPSRGEKPPVRINSRSHSCLSLKTSAGRPSASSVSFSCRGRSRAMRSFKTPPCGGLAILYLYNSNSARKSGPVREPASCLLVSSKLDNSPKDYSDVSPGVRDDVFAFFICEHIFIRTSELNLHSHGHAMLWTQDSSLMTCLCFRPRTAVIFGNIPFQALEVYIREHQWQQEPSSFCEDIL
jgi:hypothetical protein